jgi:transcriptional regulator with XRE-family HTH domain
LSKLDKQVNDTLIYIGQKLRAERERSNITRENMERIIGVSVDTIKRIEAGESASIKNVLKIAKALDIPYPMLFPTLPRDKYVIRQEIDELLNELLES